MTTLLRRHIVRDQPTAPRPGTAETNGTKPHETAPAARDPRYLALRNFAVSITVLNILGYAFLGFEQPPLWPILAVLSAYATDLFFETITAWVHRTAPRYRGRGARGVYEFLLPAHITGLAVNMLLYANDQFWPILFAVIAAIASKHVLQAPLAGKMRHFMNPSNFGITVCLLCFSSWVAVAPPYEFGENINTMFRLAIPLVLAIAGTVINASLTRRVPLIAGWLGGFVIQAVVRHELFDVALIAALGTMTGTAFILFTNYMITDPGTTPFPARAQFPFGAAAATVYGVLMAFGVVYTLFFAVTIVCAVRGGYGWLRAGERALRRRRTAGQASAATLPAPPCPEPSVRRA